jgi:hypothetical protein
MSSSLRFGRTVAQAVSRRPLTAEARIRARASPSGICGGQSGTGTGFSPSFSAFPISFVGFHTHISLRLNIKPLVAIFQSVSSH